MSNNTPTINVKILGKDYRIACNENERDELFASARIVDQKMREIRDSGRVIGTDRIAVMAALNIANELAQVQKQYASRSKETSNRLARMGEKIDAILHRDSNE
ncbi:MAG: cell division protein ZapA [Pseudomonadota bacterium]